MLAITYSLLFYYFKCKSYSSKIKKERHVGVRPNTVFNYSIFLAYLFKRLFSPKSLVWNPREATVLFWLCSGNKYPWQLLATKQSCYITWVVQWISCFILSWVCNQFINYTVNSGMVDFSIFLHLACVLPHLNCGFWNLLGYKQVWEMRWGTQFLMQLLLFALASENPDCHELLFFSSLNHEIGIIAYCLPSCKGDRSSPLGGPSELLSLDFIYLVHTSQRWDSHLNNEFFKNISLIFQSFYNLSLH